MAVTSSGELRLYADIGVELSVAQSDVSLGTMSNTAGFVDPDAMSEFYGYADASAPSVTTNNISNIGETTLTINGNITSDGGATITERGFYFGTNSSSPTSNAKYTVGGTTGYYSNNRSGLSTSTTYYCWAFATNSVGTTYGARVQASTVAAFVPAFASSGGGITQSAITLNGCARFRWYSYYQNPNTGSWITRSPSISGNLGVGGNVSCPGSYSYDYSLNTSQWSASSSFATNARNRVYIIHDQFNESFYPRDSDSSFSSYSSSSGRSFSNVTFAYDSNSYAYSSASAGSTYLNRVWALGSASTWQDHQFDY